MKDFLVSLVFLFVPEWNEINTSQIMDRRDLLIQRFIDQVATPEELLELEGILAMEEVMNANDALSQNLIEAFRQNKDSAREEDAVIAQSILKKLKQEHIKIRDVKQTDEERSPAKIISITRPGNISSWSIAAAAAGILLAVGTVLYDRYTYRSGNQTGTETFLPGTAATFKGTNFIVLPDSSTVLLNENSELKLANLFGTSNREVWLTGEASFEVKHDPARPFIVRTGNVSTTVLGTEFNIHYFQDKITVTVVRGLVQVGDDQRAYGKICPDQQIEVNVRSNEFALRNTKAEAVLEWQKRFFILDNVTFEQAVAQVEKRFNANVIIANESLKNCMVSAWFFNNENLEQVVEGLSTLKQATARKKENSIIIEGGKGCIDSL